MSFVFVFFFHSDICPDNWRYFQGYCYRKVSPCNSWTNSQSQCAILGANLPSVHSQEENVFVQSLHGGESGWLGLSDINTEGTFVWSDGSRLSFNFWATRQPNNFHNEDCVHTLGSLKNHEYKWNDVNCSSCHTYSCKKGIDSTSRFYCFNRTHFFRSMVYFTPSQRVAIFVFDNEQKKTVLLRGRERQTTRNGLWIKLLFLFYFFIYFLTKS